MDWLKQKYDRVILLIVALVTIGLAAMLMMKANSFAENFALQKVTPRNDKPVTDEPLVEESIGVLGTKSYWNPPSLPGGKQPALFLSVPIVEKDGEIINMSEETLLLRPPVTNKWLTDNNLDFLAENALEQDPDKDGFSNLEEWNAGGKPFNPKDADSHPSFLLKLTLVRRESEDYSITFKSSMGKDFSVSWKPFGGKESSDFVVEGERFADDRFLVEGMDPREVEENGIKRNRSILRVKDNVTAQTLNLVMGIPMDLPTYFAVFKFALGGAEDFRVRQGDTFKLPAGDDTTYKLIDVQEDKAEIEDIPPVGSGRESTKITVLKAAP